MTLQVHKQVATIMGRAIHLLLVVQTSATPIHSIPSCTTYQSQSKVHGWNHKYAWNATTDLWAALNMHWTLPHPHAWCYKLLAVQLMSLLLPHAVVYVNKISKI